MRVLAVAILVLASCEGQSASPGSDDVRRGLALARAAMDDIRAGLEDHRGHYPGAAAIRVRRGIDRLSNAIASIRAGMERLRSSPATAVCIERIALGVSLMASGMASMRAAMAPAGRAFDLAMLERGVTMATVGVQDVDGGVHGHLAAGPFTGSSGSRCSRDADSPRVM